MAERVSGKLSLAEWADAVFRSQENAPKPQSPHPPTEGDWRAREEDFQNWRTVE